MPATAADNQQNTEVISAMFVCVSTVRLDPSAGETFVSIQKTDHLAPVQEGVTGTAHNAERVVCWCVLLVCPCNVFRGCVCAMCFVGALARERAKVI